MASRLWIEETSLESDRILISLRQVIFNQLSADCHKTRCEGSVVFERVRIRRLPALRVPLHNLGTENVEQIPEF